MGDKMKLNNKGFAISGVLYPVFILFVTLILGVVGNLATSKAILDRSKREIELELNGDSLNPTIVYVGNTITLANGYSYTPIDDVTATDYDGKAISKDHIKYVSSPTFSNTTNGTYNITYTATDSRGRSVTGSRVINVASTPVYTIPYSGSAVAFPGNAGGLYKVELWGASGGDGHYNTDGTGAVVAGGKGAYTSGIIQVPSDSNLQLFIGGHGGNNVLATAGTAGYNGGSVGGRAYQGGAGGGGATDLRAMPKNKYRYVKDYLNGSSVNTGNHWVEIEVYDVDGNNVAAGKTVTGSTTITNGTRITDGDLASANYATMASTLRWVEVDLGIEYEIDYVKVYHYYSDARTYYETRTILYNEDRSTSYTINDYNWSGTYAESASGKTSSVLNPAVFESLKSRIMVAAAGAGASNWTNAASGGYGGTMIGASGILNPGANAHTLATGGTQSSGGTGGAGGTSPGRFGLGGAAELDHGGGGGGGYYGGGGGGVISGGVSSGAGGSSYISGLTGYNSLSATATPSSITHSGQENHYSGLIFTGGLAIAGNASMPSPISGTMTGNDNYGYARITTYIQVNN